MNPAVKGKGSLKVKVEHLYSAQVDALSSQRRSGTWYAPNSVAQRCVIPYRQAFGYLLSQRASPPLGRYQIILLGDRGTSV